MLKFNWIEQIKWKLAKKHHKEGNFWFNMEMKYLRKWNETLNPDYRKIADLCNFEEHWYCFKAYEDIRESLRKYNYNAA